ncbi:MAG: HAMP domain-containing histidine kinase [Phycisphaerales bacterium]|nr:MAG: HAMP domain-containing histidine kinase [Phycisphaerales bacterium]
MGRPLLPNISLATKCRLLFGVAVLLIVAATLLVPWVQMASLGSHLDVLKAERIANAAFLLTDLMGQDWTTAQEDLNRRWPAYARRLEFPLRPPTLISVEQAKRRGGHGFVPTSIRQLQAEPMQSCYWKISNKDGYPLLKVALAVRAGETAPNPGTLMGIIDVRMPVESDLSTWNAIVVVLSGLSGGLAALLVFYLVTQKLILSPVRGLRRLVEQVSQGDLAVRSDIATRDEFQELAQAFNDMLGNLQASQEELETINRSLDAKIDELADANVALYESNRLKSEFLANVSHELRTPLVSIIGFAELVRDAQDKPPKDRNRLKRYADNIYTSGRMLLEIINDLLDLAKIEAGKLELHISDFDVGQVCHTLIDFVQPMAGQKRQDLKLDVSPSLPPFRSDSGKVKQILYNLMSNALKFTPEGGSVEVRVEPHDAPTPSVRLSVSDTGPGIPEDQRAAVFEKFKQVDASVTREHGGTGLGLAITRELVHILGGEIHLVSEVGRGTTFVVVLPATAPEPSTPTVPEKDAVETATGPSLP